MALGLTWGVAVLALGLIGVVGWGRPMIDVLGSLYVGFGPTLRGSVIGGAWAFVDGAVAGVVVAWLYNRVSGTERATGSAIPLELLPPRPSAPVNRRRREEVPRS
jgi:hypothetical protein